MKGRLLVKNVFQKRQIIKKINKFKIEFFLGRRHLIGKIGSYSRNIYLRTTYTKVFSSISQKVCHQFLITIFDKLTLRIDYLPNILNKIQSFVSMDLN